MASGASSFGRAAMRVSLLLASWMAATSATAQPAPTGKGTSRSRAGSPQAGSSAAGSAAVGPSAPSSVASAATPTILLAAHSPQCAALAAQLRAELTALDVAVVVETSGDRNREPMAAIIKLVATPCSAQVWTARSMRQRQLSADPRQLPSGDQMLARRIAEVLRADLLLAAPGAPPPPPPAPTPLPIPVFVPVPVPIATPAPASPQLRPAERSSVESQMRSNLLLGVAPTLTLSPGPLTALAHATIDVRWYAWRGLRLRALTTLPLGHGSVSDTRGDVFVNSGMVGASLGYDLMGAPPFRVVAGIGSGWHWLHSVGSAKAPFSGSASTIHFNFSFLELDAAYELGDSIQLTAGARLGVAAPQPVLLIAGESLGGFGRPAAQLSIGVAVPLTRSLATDAD